MDVQNRIRNYNITKGMLSSQKAELKHAINLLLSEENPDEVLIKKLKEHRKKNSKMIKTIMNKMKEDNGRN